MQKEEERLLDNKYDFGDLKANTNANNKVDDEKTKPLINLNSFPTASSTKKTSNKYQKLNSAEGIDINSPITIKNDEVQKTSKNTESTKLLQKKRTNRSLENKNINGKIKANNQNTKKDLVGTKLNDNNQIKKKNKEKEKEKEKGKGLKIVNEKVINTINNNINNVGNNNVNNTNNTNNSIIKIENNNISNINPIKIEINEKDLLYRTEEYKHNTRYFDPFEDRKNLKRLYDFCLSDDENCDIHYYSYLKSVFNQKKK